MFTNRTVMGVAMLFAAVILAHPGPAIGTHFAASHKEITQVVLLPNPDGTVSALIFFNDGGFVVLDEPFEDLRSTSFEVTLSQPTIFASVEAALASLGISPEAAGTFDETVSQALAKKAEALEQGVAPEAGEVTGDAGGLDTVPGEAPGAKGIRDPGATTGIIVEEKPAEFGPDPIAEFGPGPQGRTAPGLPEDNEPVIIFPEESPPDDGKGIAQADVDKAMGVVPYPGAAKGIALPGQNVGMGQIGNPDDERSAKGVSLPNSLGGAASKLPVPMPPSKLPVPMPPSKLPAGKTLQGLKGPPVGQKVKVFPKAPAPKALQRLGRTYGRPVPEPPVRPK